MKLNNKEITDKLSKLHGVDVSCYDEGFLNRSIEKRMEVINCVSSEQYIQLLSDNNRMEADYLLKSMQICYSEFFRNSLTFATLEKIVIPALVFNSTKKREIRIWSAACAAGQEVYSLSILLYEFSNEHKRNFRIFATDYSENEIDKAVKAVYPLTSLGFLPLRYLNRWFIRKGSSYVAKDELKMNIDFSTFDLLNKELNCPPACIYGDFDLIFCANVLFYYKAEYRELILDKLTNSMTNSGLLICDEAERYILFQHNFEEVYPHSAIFRKKKNI
ncbi:MAG: CheR family methyltransferase [Paludibacter sp.]